MGGNDLGDRVGLGCIRETIQLEEDHAANTQALAYHELAEIAILRDQDAALGIRRAENVSIGRA